MALFDLPFLLDGATGTGLFAAGMPYNVCVEKWVLDHPGPLLALQRGYVESGSRALMAPTFGANREALGHHGLGDQVREFNLSLAALTKQAAGGQALTAGDVSPAGLFIEPYGSATFDDLLAVYREQVSALKEADVDYIAIETMMNLAEARAALLAAKEAGLPATVTLTVDDGGRTLSGGAVLPGLCTLAAMGADAVGLNCSTGPETVLKALAGAARLIPVPLIAKPNAGLPGGHTQTPEEFAAYGPEFLKIGVGILGGCCGTTPRHIAELHKAVAGIIPPTGNARELPPFAADERRLFETPAGELAPSPEIACGEDLADDLAELDLEGCGCVLLRVNDEEAARQFGLSYLAPLPPEFISDSFPALEAALRRYQGRALLSARCGLPKEELGALARKYGALIV